MNAKTNKTGKSQPQGDLAEYLTDREQTLLSGAEAADHTAESYTRACVKDKAVHLALRAAWLREEAGVCRNKLDSLEG